MNYKLINLEIVKTSGNSNRIKDDDSGNEYFRAAALNPFDPQEPTHTVVSFDRNIIKMYKDLLPQKRNGNLPDDDTWTEGQIPPIYRVLINAFSMDYDLGGEYCRTYTRDIIDADGNTIPGKAAGNVICNADGTPRCFSSIRVFVRQQFRTEPVFDENGAPKFTKEGNPMQRVMRDEKGTPITDWVKGWSPEDVGENMRRLLITKEAAYRKLGQTPVKQPKPTAEDIFDDENPEDGAA